MIPRNPGVAVVWSSRTWRPFRAPAPDGRTGVLFDVGDPTQVTWWAHGRAATRGEVEASIESGLPILWEAAVADGEKAVAMLTEQVEVARALLPA